MGCSVLILLLCFIFSTSGKQTFIMEPHDVTVVVGSRVKLPCRVKDISGVVQWTKNRTGLGIHRRLPINKRYSISNGNEEGDYSLIIKKVKLLDDASYQCRVGSDNVKEQLWSTFAHLTVTMAPKPPRIVQGSVLNVDENQEVNLECLSIGGKPASLITWIDSDGTVLTQGVNYTVQLMPDGRRFTAKSVLRFRARKSHHNQNITCQALDMADHENQKVTIKLQVQLAPTVEIFVKTEKMNKLQEGDTAIIGCKAIGHPNNFTYKWFVNNKLQYGEATNELVLKNVTRRYHSRTVKCEATNSVGTSGDTLTLAVEYGPSFSAKPNNVEAEQGETVSLTCEVDGHPPPNITWLRYENNRVKIVGHSSKLTVLVTALSLGNYWCKGSIEGRPDVEALALIYSRKRPKIMSNKTQYGEEGDSVRVSERPTIMSNRTQYGKEGDSVRVSERPSIMSNKTQYGEEGDSVRVSERLTIMSNKTQYGEEGDSVRVSEGPTIMSNKTQYGEEGDSVRVSERPTIMSTFALICIFFGFFGFTLMLLCIWGSLRRQASSGRLGGPIGFDAVPMTNPEVVITGDTQDVRYGVTYGNPYLRGSGPLCREARV